MICTIISNVLLCIHTHVHAQVSIQAKIDDTHVVKIYDTIRIPSNGRMVIVMEYCEGGNLHEWIKRNRRHESLNECIIMQMFKEICWAVYNCHQTKIIHRDLKPENVLLDGRRRVKLGETIVYFWYGLF